MDLKIYIVCFELKAGIFRKRYRSCNRFAGKTFSDFQNVITVENGFFFTNFIDLQAALSACLTVRDWEMLTKAVEIPENFVLEELEVSFILHWSLLPSLI